jgi:hypothetical protein
MIHYKKRFDKNCVLSIPNTASHSKFYPRRKLSEKEPQIIIYVQYGSVRVPAYERLEERYVGVVW